MSDDLISRQAAIDFIKDHSYPVRTVDIVSFLREIKDQITKSLITRDAIDKSVLLLEIRDSIIDKAIEIESCSE